MNKIDLFNRLCRVKVTARMALALVWVYEGLVPKILFLRADEIDLVHRYGVIWRTPELTIAALGIVQIVLGIWLFSGWKERWAVTVATILMFVLIVLVARGNPTMLTEPYGALIKDFCLVACAWTVWTLSPLTERHIAEIEQ